jgi:flavin-dependent dehydrogenase
MSGKIVGWPLATFNPYLPIVTDRIALLGDAAGLINPLNGEGIQYALQSARWSFETLSDGLSRDSLSATDLSSYVSRVHAEMRFDMAVSRLFVDLCRNRAFNQIWLSALEVIGRQAALDSEYAAVFGGVLAGIARARQLLAAPFLWQTAAQIAAMIGRSTAAEALRAGISMLKHSARHRAAVLDWSVQCALALLELATQGAQRQA